MLRTMFSKKKYDASEGASELTSNDDASELSSYDRGKSEIVEVDVVEDDNLVEDEHEATLDSSPSKKRRVSGVRA